MAKDKSVMQSPMETAMPTPSRNGTAGDFNSVVPNEFKKYGPSEYPAGQPNQTISMPGLPSKPTGKNILADSPFNQSQVNKKK